MSRIKKGQTALKHRKYLLERAKGYTNGAKSKFRIAKERLLKAESNAYKSRRLRKRDFRSLWISRINGATKLEALSTIQRLLVCLSNQVHC
jgi:large subunit ribosomal protein L20